MSQTPTMVVSARLPVSLVEETRAISAERGESTFSAELRRALRLHIATYRAAGAER